MTVDVEVLTEVTAEITDAFARLIPQLSASAAALTAADLERVVADGCCTVLLARAGGRIAGTLTLALFEIPTGVRAWIEDVVVDEPARGQGIAAALTREALRLAAKAGARTVDLTSRPSRAAAGRLYERMGFEQRDSRLYRHRLG
jgi:ribosomal protein S18 acetylase RimI-like enzyme